MEAVDHLDERPLPWREWADLLGFTGIWLLGLALSTACVQVNGPEGVAAAGFATSGEVWAFRKARVQTCAKLTSWRARFARAQV